ncbi:glycosyltransferase [Modestobacter sp. VKM Ac-2977]|uniref:glycosyltransferase n=1 Tax=Modestobacter sp. VKM Ac-2977 TaxID=3004131 RepID=UPI0022AABEF0|nr:glycosyltransferase [Modestobacter sp. VKM Ac-2977]MCZ2822742.1 glycosyltransferase [Modestobacter sp. VKM Ac-2977]
MTGATVVIPAHNEETGLARCLDHLLRYADDGELDVIVVANGCTDDTAAVAARYADRGVSVTETPIASKVEALRLGDARASGFPRIYLDADVVISTATARALAGALTTGQPLAAAPRLTLDLSGVGRLATRYLRVWQSLPVFDAGYVGSGCYALSEAGRACFDQFPTLTNDDEFVNGLFHRDQKKTLVEHPLTVFPARSLRGIVRRSQRVGAGRIELREKGEGGDAARVADTPAPSTARHLVRTAVSSRSSFLDVLVFGATQVVVLLGARGRRLRQREIRWTRDESSRG